MTIGNMFEPPSGELFVIGDRGQLLRRRGQVPDSKFPINAWDYSIYGPKPLLGHDGLFRMYYAGYDNDPGYATYRVCLATTTDIDGIWNKPNLGLVTYAGNTNNNIVLSNAAQDLQFLDCETDPVSGDYIMSVRDDGTAENKLYRSVNGVDFTYVPNSAVFSGEGAGISWSPLHNKYRRWYRNGGGTYRRSIGFLDSASLEGPWVDRGLRPEFTSTDSEVQFYDFSHFYYSGSMWGVFNMFAETTQLLAPLRLYHSEDHGDTWTRGIDLLQRSAPGDWDYGLITDSTPILVDGVWYYFYGGKTGHHYQFTQITLGLATAALRPTNLI